MRHLQGPRGDRAQSDRSGRSRLRQRGVAAVSGRGLTVAVDGFGAEQGFDVLAEGVKLAATDGIALRVFGPPDRLGLTGVPGVEVVPTSEGIGDEGGALPALGGKEGGPGVGAA